MAGPIPPTMHGFRRPTDGGLEIVVAGVVVDTLDNSGNRTITGDLNLTAGTLDLQDGGAVTQITSITTGVTLSTHSGAITTVSSTLVAGADATFTVTNTQVGADDLIIVHTKTYGGTADGIPICNVEAVAAGSFDLNIRNTGAVTLDAVVVISFAVIQGAIT